MPIKIFKFGLSNFHASSQLGWTRLTIFHLVACWASGRPNNFDEPINNLKWLIGNISNIILIGKCIINLDNECCKLRKAPTTISFLIQIFYNYYSYGGQFYNHIMDYLNQHFDYSVGVVKK